MSQLNQKQKQERVLGVSGNGNIQYEKSSVEQLFQLMVSTLYGKDTYYATADAKMEQTREALRNVLKGNGLKGAEYAARVIVFAREKMFIRTMPIAMTVELAKVLRDQNIKFDGMRALTTSVIQRADELTDLYAYALTVFGTKGKVPMAIKNGVADAFKKFDAYQFGKYNREGAVTLARLLRIVHAAPKDEAQSEIFAKIMADTLEAPYTWEVELSKNGQLVKEERKPDGKVWGELMNRSGSGSLPYMAMLRNVRNICGADEVEQPVIDELAKRLANPELVKKSKQLPFGFINAYEMNESAPMKVKTALGTAIEISMANLPKLGEKVWIILDCSGSMTSTGYGHKGGNAPLKVGAIFAAALFKSAALNGAEVKLTLFSDNAAMLDLNPLDSTVSMYKSIMDKSYGGGTRLDSALALKDKLGFEPDTVVVISDMEVNSLRSPGEVNKYFKGDTVKLAINLNAGETTPLDERDGWQQLSGWSESIFKYVDFSRKAPSISKQLFAGELVTA